MSEMSTDSPARSESNDSPAPTQDTSRRDEDGVSTMSNPPVNNCSQCFLTENESLEDYTCPVCMEHLIDPAVTNCDHRFCTFCLANWFHLRGTKNCPSCRTVITSLTSLPSLAETIEGLIQQSYTEVQKTEREECKRYRSNSTVMRDLGPNPLQTLTSRRFQESIFDFDLPSFDIEEALDGLETPPMLNFYATATYATSDNNWIGPMLHNVSQLAPRVIPRRRLSAPLLEISTLLDEFEISLRGSQTSYRNLMDGLTSLDPSGFYFRVVDDRLRDLGLRPENRRLVSTFPSQTLNPRSHTNADSGIDRNQRQTGATPTNRDGPASSPGASDWYFTHYDRIRRDDPERWEAFLNMRQQLHEGPPRPSPATPSNRNWNSGSGEWTQSDIRQDSRELRDEEDLGNQPRNTPQYSYPEYQSPRDLPVFSYSNYNEDRAYRQRHGRRRRRYHDYEGDPEYDFPPPVSSYPYSTSFPMFERRYDDYVRGHYAEQPYEYHGGSHRRYREPQRAHHHNGHHTHVQTDPHNMCVHYPDGTETWVDLGNLSQEDRNHGGDEDGSSVHAHAHCPVHQNHNATDPYSGEEEGLGDTMGIQYIIEQCIEHVRGTDD